MAAVNSLSLRRILFALVIVTMFFQSFTVGGARQVTPAVTDAEIIEQVKLAFTKEDDVNASRLDVECKHGVVTLRGNVRTPMIKTRAEALTRTVKGVKRVVNRIKVTSSDLRFI